MATPTDNKTPARKPDVSVSPIGPDDSPSGVLVEYGDGTSEQLIIADLAESIRVYAAYHGLNQRIRDAGAISAKLYSTAESLRAARIDRVREMVAHLRTADTWSMRASGDGSSGNAGLFWAAVARAWPGKPIDRLREEISRRIAAQVTPDRSEHAIKLSLLRDEKGPIGRAAAVIRAERDAARAAQPDALGGLLDGLDDF